MSAASEALKTAIPAGDDIGRRYLRAALLTGASGLLSRVLLGFTPLVLARVLGLEKYGVYALVMSLVGVVAGTSGLGQNAALQKFLPEYAINNPARGHAILVASVQIVGTVILVVSAVLLFASHGIARSIYRDASLAGVFQFSILAVAATVLFNHFSSIIIGLHRITTLSFASVVRSAAFLIFGAGGAWFFGLYGALAGQVIAAVLALAILISETHSTAAWRLHPGDVTFAFRDVATEIMSFGIPALLAGVVVTFGNWWGSTMLVRHAGLPQLGLFGAAYSLMQVMLLLPSSLTVPAVSFLSETRAASGQQAFSDLVGNNLRLIWALTLPISFAFALFARNIMVLAFGNGFAPAAGLTSWMAFTALIIAINSQIGSAISSLGRMWQALAINAIWLTIFMPVSYVAVARTGALGLAVAYCISYVIFTVVVWKYSQIYLDVRYQRLAQLISNTAFVLVLSLFLARQVDGLVVVLAKLASLALLLVSEWLCVLRPEERRNVSSLMRRCFSDSMAE